MLKKLLRHALGLLPALLLCAVVIGCDEDAGPPDAGGVDAGAVDEDAGGTDAGGIDAGPPADAGADAGHDAAVACSPAVPEREAASEFGPTPIDAVLPASGLLAIIDARVMGRTAVVWDGAAWRTESVTPRVISSSGRTTFGELDGRTALLANYGLEGMPVRAPRIFAQAADLSFAAGELIPGVDSGSFSSSRWDADTSLFSAVGNDSSYEVVRYLERNAGGAWSVSDVAAARSGESLRPAGLGVFDDGTAWVAAEDVSADALVLYRRAGGRWDTQGTVMRDITAPYTFAPPAGASTRDPVAVVLASTDRSPFARRFSAVDGAPLEAQGFLTGVLNFDYIADVAFAPDGASGYLLLANRRGLAFVSRFEGNTFMPVVGMRPDLVFDAGPALLHHPCGGFMVVHASRPPSDPEGSASLVVEPLADFAPAVL